MMSRYTFLLFILCLVAGGGVFEMKHSVAAMRDKLARVEADIADEHRRIRVLEADWAHVIRPDRMARLAEDVGMVRANVRHVVKADRIGQRRLLELARYSIPVPLSETKSGLFRVKPPTSIGVSREDWQ